MDKNKQLDEISEAMIEHDIINAVAWLGEDRVQEMFDKAVRVDNGTDKENSLESLLDTNKDKVEMIYTNIKGHLEDKEIKYLKELL